MNNKIQHLIISLEEIEPLETQGRNVVLSKNRSIGLLLEVGDDDDD